VARSGTIRGAIRYGFAVGRVRVLEAGLLSNATLERLLDAKTFEAQKRVLADTVYGRYLEHAQTGRDVEQGLDEFNADIFDFMEESNLPEAVIRFFRVSEDYVNLKSSLKARAVGAELEVPGIRHGSVDRERFVGSLETLPAPFGEVAAQAMDEDGEVVRDLVDRITDAALFRDLLVMAKEADSDYLIGLARLTIDLGNLRLIVRSKRAGRRLADVGEELFEGGTVDPKDLLALYPLDVAEMATRLSGMAPFKEVSSEHIANVERLDVVADNLLMRHAKKARLIAVGVEPVVGYVIARHSEIVVLRMLLLGKLAGLGAEAMRRRIRELYV